MMLIAPLAATALALACTNGKPRSLWAGAVLSPHLDEHTVAKVQDLPVFFPSPPIPRVLHGFG